MKPIDKQTFLELHIRYAKRKSYFNNTNFKYFTLVDEIYRRN